MAAFASDINRFSTAAFESLVVASKSARFPRSTAWLLINSYYAAFFSAHAILRILGTSCSQLGYEQIARITAVADLFAVAGEPLARGLYRCDFVASENALSCKRVDLSGVHESFWSVFYVRLNQLSNDILLANNLPVRAKQFVAGKLAELAAILATEGCPRGNWLSQIRNRVTYNQQFGVWFPYSGPKQLAVELFRLSPSWLKNPLEVTLQSNSQLRLFQEACLFIVGLCRVLAEDVLTRCPTNNSFCEYGAPAFLRLLAAK
jgi:hypothetical protein